MPPLGTFVQKPGSTTGSGWGLVLPTFLARKGRICGFSAGLPEHTAATGRSWGPLLASDRAWAPQRAAVPTAPPYPAH